ncbi:MAG: nitronate monooxygenase [Bacteroidales bacterium]
MQKLQIGNLITKFPIIQGGMGVGVSLSGLASAVANQGGIGVISAAGLGLLYKKFSRNYAEASIMGLKQELTKAREKTDGIIGVNIMVAMTNYADMVKTAIAEKVDIIFSGAGLPLDLPSYLSPESTTKLVPIVSSARAFKVIANKWKSSYNFLPSAVVVEGPKAGGHLGYKVDQIENTDYSLEHILVEVLAEVKLMEAEYQAKIPVIAAGGIYTGEDIYKIMALGASGVQMGTRFVTTDECDASVEFKNTYMNANEKDIVLIKSPVGMPGRAIESVFIQQVNLGNKQPKICPFHCIKTCDISKSPYCIMLALYNAFKGNFNLGYAFAGTNAYKAKAIQSVKETFYTLSVEFDAFSAKLKRALPLCTLC